jgi:hypothetical protein
MLASNLEKAESIAISGPNNLVLRFQPRYNHQSDHCRETTSVARTQDALKKITGRVWNIRVETAQNGMPESPAAAATEISQSRYRRQRTEAMQEPLIKRAMELLEAQIVQVDDGFGAAPAAADRPEQAEES